MDRPDAPPLQEPTLNAQRRTLNLMAMTNDFAAGAAFMTNDWSCVNPQSFVTGHRVSDAVICH